MRTGLADLTVTELEAVLSDLNAPRYRARQLFQWVHNRGVWDPSEMTDLPRGLREELARRFVSSPPLVVHDLRSGDGLTAKLLLRLEDGELIETVVMESRGTRRRATVCVSTQAGCAMGCVFCATGQAGFSRQLSAGEIVAQAYLARSLVGNVTNLVFMGMGEPLANYDDVIRATRLLHDPLGMNLSFRAITLSTVGLVPQIHRLSREGLPVNLAISIHSPYDELRSELMPVNRRWPIAELVAAADEYAARTGRRVSYEYTLIRGVNDSLEHARALGQLLGGRLCHVNLIPLNPTTNHSLSGTNVRDAQTFRAELTRWGVTCTIRVNRGRDINAACGQLRRRVVTVMPPEDNEG